MSKISLTKSGLQKEKQQLLLYVKLLPSLELKRMQLMAEYARAQTEKAHFQEVSEKEISAVDQKLPMVGNRDIHLEKLLSINSIEIGEQNIVGIKLPYLKKISFDVLDYSFLATPHWVDAALLELKKGIEARMNLKIMDMRIDKLKTAVRRMTQRVNLFEKILIPSSKKNIQKIQIALGDAERTAVIRSKLAKGIQPKQKEMERGES